MNEFAINKDDLKGFFSEPTLESFNDFLKQNLGEGNQLEFKEKWVNEVKLAKILLGMANCGSGCLVIGVSEDSNKTLIANGIPEGELIYDMAVFSKTIEKYFPKTTHDAISLKNFFYDNDVYGKLRGKKFQVVFIKMDLCNLPVICESDGEKEKDKIFRGEIYTRRGSSTERINYEELQSIITLVVQEKQKIIRDIELSDELKQLRALYDAIPPTYSINSFSALRHSHLFLQMMSQKENNVYPSQSFEEFLKEVIEKKEELIKAAVLK